MITFSILIHPPLTPIVTEVAVLWCQDRAMPPGWPPEILGRVGRKVQNTNFAETQNIPPLENRIQKPTCTEST